MEDVHRMQGLEEELAQEQERSMELQESCQQIQETADQNARAAMRKKELEELLAQSDTSLRSKADMVRILEASKRKLEDSNASMAVGVSERLAAIEKERESMQESRLALANEVAAATAEQLEARRALASEMAAADARHAEQLAQVEASLKQEQACLADRCDTIEQLRTALLQRTKTQRELEEGLRRATHAKGVLERQLDFARAAGFDVPHAELLADGGGSSAPPSAMSTPRGGGGQMPRAYVASMRPQPSRPELERS